MLAPPTTGLSDDPISDWTATDDDPIEDFSDDRPESGVKFQAVYPKHVYCSEACGMQGVLQWCGADEDRTP